MWDWLKQFWSKRVVKVLSAFVFFGGLLGTVQGTTGLFDEIFGSSAPALTVTALTDVAAFKSQAPYVPQFLFPEKRIGPVTARDFPSPPDATNSEQLGASPQGGRWAWAHARDAIDAGNTLVRLVFVRSSSKPTAISGVEAADVRCGAQREGTLLTYEWRYIARQLIAMEEAATPPGGANYMLIHLDGLPGHMGVSITHPEFNQPQVSYIRATGKRTALPIPMSISYGQEKGLDLLVTSRGADCKWKIRVLWTSGGEAEETVLPSSSGFYETTGVPSEPWLDGGEDAEPVAVRYWSSIQRAWEAPTGQTWGYKVGPGALRSEHCEVIRLPMGPHEKPTLTYTCY